jgi:hypothetical protein
MPTWTEPTLRRARRRIAATLLVAWGVAMNAHPRAAAAQELMMRAPSDTIRLGSGRIASGDSQPTTFILRRPSGSGIVAMTVQARMRPTRSQLIALSVFELRDGLLVAPALCQAEGFGPLLQCRALLAGGEASTYQVSVAPAGGKGGNEVSVLAIPVAGPLIRGTSLSVADARPVEADRTVTDSLGYGGDRGNAALYLVRLPADAPDSVYVSLTPAERRSMRMNVLDLQGRVLDEFEPTDAFAQRRLSRGGARSLLLLVQPAEDDPSPTRYTVRVGANPSAVQALAPDGESSWSGTGAQRFDLRVPAGWSGVIALGGRGQQLRVSDSSGTSWPVESAFGGTTLGVRVGEPWAGSRFVRRGLTRPTRLTVDIVPDVSQRYRSDWDLTVRGKRGSGTTLVAFPVTAAEPWPTIWQSGDRMVNLTGGVRALMIPPPPDQFRTHGMSVKQSRAPEGGFRFGARLTGGAEQFYDIAVTDEWGDVIDIADAGVFWQWPGDRERLAIVIFAQPGTTAQSLPPSARLVIQSPTRPSAEVIQPARTLPAAAAAATVTRPRPRPQATVPTPPRP